MVSEGTLVFASGLLGALVLSLLLGLRLIFREPLKDTLGNFDMTTLKILVTAFVFSNIVNIAARSNPEKMFTSFIYGLEGNLVMFFQQYTPPILTFYFIFSYLLLYPCVILLTFFKLYSTNRESSINYAGAYMILLLLSMPFFYFLPVGVVGYYLETVDPILYTFHPYFNQALTAFDPLTKALPSLHTGMPVLATLFAFRYTESYRWGAAFMSTSVILSTFYLGIHWVTDAILGALLAALSFLVVESELVEPSAFPDSMAETGFRLIDNLLRKIGVER